MISVIGSVALNSHQGIVRNPADLDIIGEYDDIVDFVYKIGKPKAFYPIERGNKVVAKFDDLIVEGEIVWDKDSTIGKIHDLIQRTGQRGVSCNQIVSFADINTLYMLKMSHRYKKNSPHFLKTMDDIHRMRNYGAVILDEELYKAREAETYTYAHPKLNQDKDSFFKDDGVMYTYDHDTIHLSVMRGSRPAYMEFKPADKEVWCDKNMFFAASEEVRLNAVYEESCVLALERSQIPFPETKPLKSFTMALQKVCTSITSGWFREYAWEHYHQAMELYDPNYVSKFWNDVDAGLIKPFSKSLY